MNKNLLTFMTIAFIAQPAMAAGTGGISDLVAPAVNFVIFFLIIFFAIKDTVVNHFNKLADDVKSLMNSAAEKSKDAESKLATYEQKIKSLETESVKIKDEYEHDFAKFSKASKEETETNIARLQRDTENKLTSERQALIEELNKELLESVVAKTKTTFNANAEVKKQATNKLIAEVR